MSVHMGTHFERELREYALRQPYRLYGRCSDCGEMAYVYGRSRGRLRCLACLDVRRAGRRR